MRMEHFNVWIKELMIKEMGLFTVKETLIIK